MIIKKKLLIFTTFYLFMISAYVAVGFAASSIYVSNYGDGTCSLENVKAAYDDASAGDTIVFPTNGNGTWSTELAVRKPVTIDGAGSTLTASGTMYNGFFHITGFTSSELVRITGFTFQMNNFTPRYGIKTSSVALDNLRIDHNTFHFGATQLEVAGVKGVVDNNYFYNGNTDIYYTAGTSAQAHASWDSMAAGTADALFIENNYFIVNANHPGPAHNNNIDTYNGGKLVIRYNEFDSDANRLDTTAWTIQTHGNAAGGLPPTKGYWESGDGARRGQSVVEIYENNMHGKRIDFLCTIRGSANLIYNNTHSDNTGGTARIYMYEEEYYETSNWSPSRTSWPAEDQVHNTFIWGNTFDGGVAQSSANIVVIPDADAGLKENRDYFLHEPRATGGKVTFTGRNGAAGSYPTNGSTYPTLGTMVFTSSGPNAYYGYKAYTYPHPLRDGSQSTSPSIQPVQNLIVAGQ